METPEENSGGTGFWLIPLGFAVLLGLKALGHGIAGKACMELVKFFLTTSLFVGAILHMRHRMEENGVTVHACDEGSYGKQMSAIAGVIFLVQILAPTTTPWIVGVSIVWMILNWIFIR